MIALAVLGAVLAFGIATSGDGDAHHLSAYDVGQAAPTSFGSIAVQDVSLLNGLTNDDLGGMAHAIQNLIPPDKVEVKLTVVLTNATSRTINYSLSDQVKVVSSSGQEVEQRLPEMGPTLSRLPSRSSVSAGLLSIAPRDGGDLFLEFYESGQSRPVRIHVATTDQATQATVAGYHDHDSPGVKEAPSN